MDLTIGLDCHVVDYEKEQQCRQDHGEEKLNGVKGRHALFVGWQVGELIRSRSIPKIIPKLNGIVQHWNLRVMIVEFERTIIQGKVPILGLVVGTNFDPRVHRRLPFTLLIRIIVIGIVVILLEQYGMGGRGHSDLVLTKGSFQGSLPLLVIVHVKAQSLFVHVHVLGKHLKLDLSVCLGRKRKLGQEQFGPCPRQFPLTRRSLGFHHHPYYSCSITPPTYE
eukprot:scaffold11999_cov56-Attheya_sp.AAC.3